MSKRARASRVPGNTARARLLDRRSSVPPAERTSKPPEETSKSSGEGPDRQEGTSKSPGEGPDRSEGTSKSPGEGPDRQEGTSKSPGEGPDRAREVVAAASDMAFEDDVAEASDGSLNPVHDDDDDDLGLEGSSALVERQARLRRIVLGVVGVAALLVVGALVKGALTKPALSPASSAAVSVAPTPTPSGTAVSLAASASTVVPVEAPPAASASAAAEAIEEAPPTASAEPAPAAAALDAEALTELRAKTQRLFDRGLTKDGIASARELVAADPTDAMSYLLLASGLQLMGKWPEGIEVYRQCVRDATRGPVAECKRFGGVTK